MKEVILSLPEKTYDRRAAVAASAHKSPEQWMVDTLTTEPAVHASTAEVHTLLVAALEA